MICFVFQWFSCFFDNREPLWETVSRRQWAPCRKHKEFQCFFTFLRVPPPAPGACAIYSVGIVPSKLSCTHVLERLQRLTPHETRTPPPLGLCTEGDMLPNTSYRKSSNPEFWLGFTKQSLQEILKVLNSGLDSLDFPIAIPPNLDLGLGLLRDSYRGSFEFRAPA